jgi:cyclopropane fatty-acyl-phospholipid synthase-like methyltransferase
MGTLHVTEQGNVHETLRGALPGVTAKLFVRTPAVYASFLEKGTLAFFEAWMRGDVTSDNIGLLIYLFVSNKRLLEALNPHHHKSLLPQRRYPLSLHHADFLSVWMGKRISFGAGFFDGLVETLDQAIEGRYHAIRDAMVLRDHDSLLYIGQTMGSFPAFFAENVFSSRLHCLTHGHYQKQTVQKEMQVRGFDKRVTVEAFDLPALQGRYDFIVVNHILEVMPAGQWEEFFYKLKDMLRPEGRIIVQVCLSKEEGKKGRKKEAPGLWSFMAYEDGRLMSEETLLKQTQKNYLRVREQKAYPKDMARTCKLLRASLDDHALEIRRHNDATPHRLLWAFLLSLIEATCLQGDVIPMHFVLEHDV